MHAGTMNPMHDVTQSRIHFLLAPASADGILGDFQSTDRYAASIGSLARRKETPAARNTSTASSVQGMLAPSATSLQPFSTSILASRSVSSFWIAHGRAMSACRYQGVLPT